jgi:hypothetical protein
MRRFAYILVASTALSSGCFIDPDDDDDTDTNVITECHIDCDDDRTTCAAGCKNNTCSLSCDDDRDACYTDCD